MSALLFNLPSRVLDANGVVSPGAKAYFYQTGTTTLQNVFTTDSLTVAHPNPVTADAGGKFPAVYLNNSLEYRVVIKSSDDSQTFFDVDPYNPSAVTTFVNTTIDTAAPNTIRINGNTLAAAAGSATLTFPNSTTTIVGRDTTDTLTNKTLTAPVLNAPTINNPTFNGTPIEDVFTITDGAAFEIDPANGSWQAITLGANRTPKATNFQNGQTVTLYVNDGSGFTLTWTDATFGGTGVKWLGGSAPILATTGLTWITLWKIAGQVYGCLNGTTT